MRMVDTNSASSGRTEKRRREVVDRAQTAEDTPRRARSHDRSPSVQNGTAGRGVITLYAERTTSHERTCSCAELFCCVRKIVTQVLKYAEVCEYGRRVTDLLLQTAMSAVAIRLLLAMSGDVEENPGPGTEDPTLKHKNIFNAIKDVVQWKLLGTQLEIPYAKIMEIDMNNRGQVRDCINEMVDYWLQSDCSCSWKKLVDALKLSGHLVLAEKTAATYCKGEVSEGDSKATTVNKPEVPDKPDKPEVPDKPDKPEVPDKPDKPEVPDNKPELLPVPNLPERKGLTFDEFKPFMDTTLPDYPCDKNSTDPIGQVEAIDFTRMSPKVLTQLFFNMNLHKGWNAAHAEPSGYPIFMPPNSRGLFRYLTNESQKSYWKCCVDFTKRGQKSGMMCSVDAYGNIASPFCSFACQVTNEQKNQKLKIDSTYRMSKKLLSPIGKFNFIPHQAIRINDADAGDIGITPEFSKSICEAFSEVDPKTVDLQTLIDKMSGITQVYGDCYAKKLTFGVAAYGETMVKITDEQHLKEVNSYQGAAGKGVGTFYGVPVDGGASISYEELKRLETQLHIERREEKWTFIGIAAATTDKLDVINKYRQSSKQWAVMDVEEWGSIQELFPLSVQNMLKDAKRRFPSFIWQLGIDMKQRYFLSNNEYLITRWASVFRGVKRFRQWDAGIQRAEQNNCEREEVREHLTAIPAGKVIPTDDKYTWKREESAWIIVWNASMGDRIALKNLGCNKFLTVIDGYEAGLRQINDNNFSANDLFTVTVEGEFVKIGWKEGESTRYLKINTDQKMKNWSKEVGNEQYHKWFYASSTTWIESESWAKMEQEFYKLKFVDYHDKEDSIKWNISDK